MFLKNILKNKRKYTKGITILETVISIGVLVAVISIVALSAINSLLLTQKSIRKSEALKLSQAGIEAVTFLVAVKDPSVITNTNEIKDGYYWMQNDVNGVQLINKAQFINGNELNLNTIFTENNLEYGRIISINSTANSFVGRENNTRIVESIVNWKDSSGTQEVKLQKDISIYDK